jgi:hypothetical protein
LNFLAVVRLDVLLQETSFGKRGGTMSFLDRPASATGITHGRRPRFSKDFLSGNDSIAAAIKAYAQAVRAGEFPSDAHAF